MTDRELMQQALEALENSVDLVREDAHEAEKLYGNYPTRQGKVNGLKVLADDHEKAIAALRAALAEPQIDDPAIHFCHRFAILTECMLLSNDSNLNKYWDEAHALLDEYNLARDKWMEAQGQPYVSGFGKD